MDPDVDCFGDNEQPEEQDGASDTVIESIMWDVNLAITFQVSQLSLSCFARCQ